MLHARINLIKSYLRSLPQTQLTDATLSNSQTNTSTQAPNHVLLRSISALLSRLPLLAPPSSTSSQSTNTTTTSGATIDPLALTSASAAETSDVHLITLLSSLTKTIGEARDFGAKNMIVSRARDDRKMASMARGEMGMGMGMGMGGRGGGAGGFGMPGSEDLTPDSMY